MFRIELSLLPWIGKHNSSGAASLEFNGITRSSPSLFKAQSRARTVLSRPPSRKRKTCGGLL
ncbi:hypothetical protein NC651_007518 [Populus alba x Populus x berolinensis]|nr:hypothetical protein NC651_007518 [Populus alba x Populus x berolinensis]